MNKIYIDTNIIVYANDKRVAKKQKKAIEIVKSPLLQSIN
jgi:predicted nucleic acid-binding protein